MLDIAEWSFFWVGLHPFYPVSNRVLQTGKAAGRTVEIYRQIFRTLKSKTSGKLLPSPPVWPRAAKFISLVDSCAF
jgi:hypothetical protein